MAQHHDRGASKCERYSACPGSPILCKGLPNKSNEYSAEGSVAHLVAAHKLLNRLGIYPQIRAENPEDDPGGTKAAAINAAIQTMFEVGETYPYDGFNIVIDEDMDRHTDDYVNLILDYKEKYGLRNDQVFVEHKVEIPLPQNWYFCTECAIDGEDMPFCKRHQACIRCTPRDFSGCNCLPDDGLFGTADIILHVPFDRIIVLDLKYGAGVVVKAKDNKQLLFYALGAYLAMPEWTQQNINVIEVARYQPRIPFGDALESYEYSVPELMQFYADLIVSIEKSMNPRAPLKAGEWCKWCPAGDNAICPELKRQAELCAVNDFADVSEEGSFTLPDPWLMTPAEKAVVLNNTKILEAFIKGVRAAAYVDLDRDPDSIPDWKIVEGRTHRQFIDKKQAEETLKEKFGDKIYTKPKLVTPAQIEKLATTKEAKKELKALVADMTFNPPGKKTLVPISDSREPAELGVIEQFTGAEDTDEPDRNNSRFDAE